MGCEAASRAAGSPWGPALPRLSGHGLGWGRCCLLAPLSFPEALGGRLRLCLSSPSCVSHVLGCCVRKAPLAACAAFLWVLGLGLLIGPLTPGKKSAASYSLRLRVSKMYKLLFLSCLFVEVLSDKFCKDFLAPFLMVMDLLDHRISDFCSHPLLDLAGPMTKENFTQKAKSF